ncbi:hypothetical protein J2S19_000690 [Metabacillus malikii]|uniref:YmaF family protein n=2 Tax=Metabacillus malikii TaxID=1504265 RepID=A0ABT9ZB12_9BACI|nr:hypothetical protein [Metabacillus malikii]
MLFNINIRPHHAHRIYAKTTNENGHTHMIKGFTRNVNGNSFDKHVHRFQGITTFENGHNHRFYGVTGPAIPLPGGAHYHKIEERTYFNYDEPLEIKHGGVWYANEERSKHDHRFKGRTYDRIGVDPFFYESNKDNESNSLTSFK